MSETFTPPAGVDAYTDALGRTQYRAVGPNGTFLVTRHDTISTWKVWRSDSLNDTARDRDLTSACELAVYYAHAGHRR